MKPNWTEFTARYLSPQHGDDAESWATLHTQLFGSGLGKRWLDRQRAEKFGRSLPADVAESTLRYLEGQRQMLRDIDRLVTEGRDQLAAKNNDK